MTRMAGEMAHEVEQEGIVKAVNPDGSYEVELEYPIKIWGHPTKVITVEDDQVIE